MAPSSEQHGQKIRAEDFHNDRNEDNCDHAELMDTQVEISSSDVPAPDHPVHTLEGLSGCSTEGLPAHSAHDSPSANHDLPNKHVDLSSSLDTKKSEINAAMMRRMKALAANRLPRKPVVTGAGAIFKGSRRDNSSEEPKNTSDRRSPDKFDNTEEVDSELVDGSTTSDYNDASKFKQVKKSYKAKCRAGGNTQEDDIMFTYAQSQEKARLARVEAAYRRERGSSDSDDSDEAAVDNPDSLFVPLHEPVRKRRRAASPAQPSEAVEDMDSSAKRARKATGTHRTKYYEEERRQSMLAGIEEILAKMRRKKDSKAKKSNGNTDNTGAIDEECDTRIDDATNTATKGKGNVTRDRLPKVGNCSTLSGLFSNVFEDSAANADKPALPVDTETLKARAMTNLIASMPLGERRAAGNDKQRILKATRDLGFRSVTMDGEGKWTLKGMKTSLYHYQVLAASWMKDRESDRVRPNGGLLADAMGLGKTVETIATMVANKPMSADYRCTLIVASQNLLNQWERELAKHTKAGVFPLIIRHSKSNRISGSGAVSVMQRADAVLTTYQEVLQSYPDIELPPELKESSTTEDEIKAWWESKWQNERKDLHRVHFYRIVLDEAQAIKNHRSKTSIACRGLMADMRWTLTATPISNTVEELFPYFKFIRVKHTGSFTLFKDNFCSKENKKCTPRLHSYLLRFMCRRTHADKLLGSPILTLPPCIQTTKKLTFTVMERNVYQEVRIRYIRAINEVRKMEKEDPQRLKNLVLTYLTRLRQMTAHIFLIQDTMEEFFPIKKLESLFRTIAPEIAAEEDHGQKMAAEMRAKIAEIATGLPKESVSDSQPESTSDNSSRFRRYFRNMVTKNVKEFKERTLCQKCKDIPEDPWVTSCLHIYCKECLDEMTYEASRNGEERTACLACSEIFTSTNRCVGITELEMPDDSFTASRDSSNQPRGRKRLEQSIKWIDVAEKIVPSTKTAAVQTQIEQWLSEEPDKKIIVFSQWHMMIQILARTFQEQNWKYCTYHGKMSYEAREKAINDFQDEPEIKIMIASLKCGGVGLNLTMASKVICTDLWFNSDVEQQAFCRVYRIGQKSDTVITRFIILDTVDEKLIEMQERKRKHISEVMDEKKMLEKMSVKELMELFGPVETDSDGAPFIYVEEDLDSESDPLFSEILAFKNGRKNSGSTAKESQEREGAEANKDSTDGEGSKGDESPIKGKGSKAMKKAKKNSDSLLAEVTMSDEVEDSFDEAV